MNKQSILVIISEETIEKKSQSYEFGNNVQSLLANRYACI
jgi:hypothetical protein